MYTVLPYCVIDIGYCDEKQSKKDCFICFQDNIDDMYSDRGGGEITFRCYDKKDIATSKQVRSHKHKQEVRTKQQVKEEEVDHI